jgi:hypothetical protein
LAPAIWLILIHHESKERAMAAKIRLSRRAFSLLLIIWGTNRLTSLFASANRPSLKKIEITGPSEVAEDSSAYYSCKAFYDDGSSEDVTRSASWSEDCWYADIFSGGRLTTGTVTRDETCRIYAVYEGMRNSLAITVKNVVKAITRLEVEGPSEVNENESAYFKCWAYYDDGTWENVSDAADWFEDSWQAGFESRGRLVAGAVNSTIWIRCWVDFKGIRRYFDVRILNSTRALIRLEIRGPREIKENSSAYYSCAAFFDDGGTEDVSSAVDWSEDSWHAEVSSGGRVSTSEVEEDQWFRLTARYQGREDSLQIKIVNVSPAALRPNETPSFRK